MIDKLNLNAFEYPAPGKNLPKLFLSISLQATVRIQKGAYVKTSLARGVHVLGRLPETFSFSLV